MTKNKFEILNCDDPNWIAVRLLTEHWIVDFHLSYLDDYGDFELYGDEPEIEYLGDGPVFMINDSELATMVANAEWR